MCIFQTFATFKKHKTLPVWSVPWYLLLKSMSECFKSGRKYTFLKHCCCTNPLTLESKNFPMAVRILLITHNYYRYSYQCDIILWNWFQTECTRYTSNTYMAGWCLYILDNQCLLTIKVSMRATNLKQKHKSSIFEVKR